MINGKRSKLTMAMAEEKRHYKMYKRGKTWVIVGMSLFFTTAFGAVTMQTAKADTAVTDTAQVGTSSAKTTTSDQPADATNSAIGSSAAPAASDDQSASSVATAASSAQAKAGSVARDATAVPATASSAVAVSGNESARSASDGMPSAAPASSVASSAEKWTPRVARVSYKMAVAAPATQVKSEDDATSQSTTGQAKNGTPVDSLTTTFESNGSSQKVVGDQLQVAFSINPIKTGVSLKAGDQIVLKVDPKGWSFDTTSDGNNPNFTMTMDKTAGTITFTVKDNVDDLAVTTLTVDSKAVALKSQTNDETYTVGINYYSVGNNTTVALTPDSGGLTFMVQPDTSSNPGVTTEMGSYLAGLAVDSQFKAPNVEQYRNNQISRDGDNYNFVFEEPVMAGMLHVSIPNDQTKCPDSFQYTVTSDHDFVTDSGGNLAYQIYNGADLVTDKSDYTIKMNNSKSFTVSVSNPSAFVYALNLTYFVKNPVVTDKVTVTGELSSTIDGKTDPNTKHDQTVFKYLAPANPGYMPVLKVTTVDATYQDQTKDDKEIIQTGISSAYVNQATGAAIDLKDKVTIASIVDETTQQTVKAGDLQAGKNYKVTYKVTDPKSGNTVSASGEIKVATFTTQNVTYHVGDEKPTLLSLVQSEDSINHPISADELSGTIDHSILTVPGDHFVPVTYHGETKNATITVIAADAIKAPTGTHVYDGQTTASQVPVTAMVDDKTSVALTYGTDYTFVNPDDAKNVNVGTYQVTLTADGKQAIQKAIGNSGVNFGDGLGQVTITPATVTITGPKVAKEYDGKPYSGELKATITGLPTSGSPVNYTLTDMSGEVNPGTYTIGVTVADGGNPNYRIVTVPGQLTITEKSGPTDPTDPKGPTDPTGPTNPTDPKGPIDPTGPTNPTGPNAPTDPTAPTTPEDPTAPTTPEDPTQPGRQEEQTPLTPEPKPITEKKHETPGKTGQSSRHQQSINQQKLTRHAKLVTVTTVKTKAGQSSTPAGTTKAKTLPQTGDDVNQQTTLMGAALLGIISLLGLVGIGRKKRDELK